MDIVTYALCKNYTNKQVEEAISGLSQGMTFKGSVASVEDLPTTATSGDLYLIEETTLNAPVEELDIDEEPAGDDRTITTSCKAVYINNDWLFFDYIPRNTSQLFNDAGFIDEEDLEASLLVKADKTYVDSKVTAIRAEIPTKVSQLLNDSGYLTEHQSLAGYATQSWVEAKNYLVQSDISNLATKTEVATSAAAVEAKIPTTTDPKGLATQSWVEGKGYLTEHQSLAAYRTSASQDVLDALKQDKLTAGENISIVGDVISATGGSSLMGRNFTTDVTVGNLAKGTQIKSDDLVSSILYKILYGGTGETITFWSGATNEIPTSNAGLTASSIDPSAAIAGFTKTIVCNDQYAVIACQKGTRNLRLKSWVPTVLPVALTYASVDCGTYNLYYLSDGKITDVGEGGTSYTITFEGD